MKEMTLKKALKFIAQLVRVGRRHHPKTRTDNSKSARLNPQPSSKASLRLNPEPSFVATAEDVRSTTVRQFQFYPEDLEKMKTMTFDEKMKFSAQLVRAGRIYFPGECMKG